MTNNKDLSDKMPLDGKQCPRDVRAELMLAEAYGIPPRPDGKPPVFNLGNINLGRVYLREKAAPEYSS